MRTLHEIVETAKVLPLSSSEMDWIRMLRADWQVIADLASADLAIWLPTEDGRFIAAALCRSATTATLHVDDIVGLYAPAANTADLETAWTTGEIVDPDTVRWAGLYSSTVSYIPIRCAGRILGVMSREANMSAASRMGGSQEWTFVAADILCEMVANGEFPDPDAPMSTTYAQPRVTDGTVLIDDEGVVLELSPNANSSMRRLGVADQLIGRTLVEAVTDVMMDGQRIEETLAVVLMGKAPWRVDVSNRDTSIVIRAIPLIRGGRRVGAVLLTRNVTAERRHEQQLMTKDATIREIHHRVKNNLQTVSALLRIQERRTDSAKVKAALKEAGRRVESIASVHDALSQNVDEVVRFDDVAPRILQMSAQIATAGAPVALEITGEFGEVGAEQASALATVLAELTSNAVEHGTPAQGGTIRINAVRGEESLTITVEDEGNGVDLGTGVDPVSNSRGLGTQIVQAMVTGELHGSINWTTLRGGGTRAELKFIPFLGDFAKEE